MRWGGVELDEDFGLGLFGGVGIDIIRMVGGFLGDPLRPRRRGHLPRKPGGGERKGEDPLCLRRRRCLPRRRGGGEKGREPPPSAAQTPAPAPHSARGRRFGRSLFLWGVRGRVPLQPLCGRGGEGKGSCGRRRCLRGTQDLDCAGDGEPGHAAETPILYK